MAKHSESRTKQPWFIRRVFYIIIGLVGAALFAFGIADTAQIEEWTAAAERLAAPVLMVLTSVLAAPKANPGADKGASDDLADAAPAPSPKQPAPQNPAGNDLLAQLRDRIAQNRG